MNMHYKGILLAVAQSALLASILGAELLPLPSPTIRKTNHSIYEKEDISALSIHGKHIIIASDEGSSIQILTQSNGDLEFEASAPISLFGTSEELDIEGITHHENTWYVAGSHSQRRRKVDRDDDGRDYAKNRKRLTKDGLRKEPFRSQILRFELDPDQPHRLNIDKIDLSKMLAADSVFAAHANIPSKENGIDIEGIATDGESIWLGFRAPVFRNGWVPIMRLRFDHPEAREVLFVNLEGSGIRDIVKCPSSPGFLIIAGAVGDSPLPYQLYYWDGKDTLPGKRPTGAQSQGEVTLLGDIPTPKNAKAEGIDIVSENAASFEVMIAYDSAANGHLSKFKAPKP